MPLFFSLSIAAHEYRIRILDIFSILSSAIHVFFSQRQYNSVINRAWGWTFGMHSKENYFRKVIDAAKDIIWFMYYDCDEDSRLRGIWCGQSYIDACKTIGYDINNLNEKNLPVISWCCCYCGSLVTNLEDINLRCFIDKGAIPQYFGSEQILERRDALLNEEKENFINPFRVLDLTIDNVLGDENLSSDELDQRLTQLDRRSEERLLKEYEENGLKLLSSSLKTYLESIHNTINREKNEDNDYN